MSTLSVIKTPETSALAINHDVASLTPFFSLESAVVNERVTMVPIIKISQEIVDIEKAFASAGRSRSTRLGDGGYTDKDIRKMLSERLQHTLKLKETDRTGISFRVVVWRQDSGIFPAVLLPPSILSPFKIATGIDPRAGAYWWATRPDQIRVIADVVLPEQQYRQCHAEIAHVELTDPAVTKIEEDREGWVFVNRVFVDLTKVSEGERIIVCNVRPFDLREELAKSVRGGFCRTITIDVKRQKIKPNTTPTL